MSGVPHCHVPPIRDPDPTLRLLEAASRADPRVRDSWPERDVALVALYASTGVRLAEGLGLTCAPFDGPAGAGAWWCGARARPSGPSRWSPPWRR